MRSVTVSGLGRESSIGSIRVFYQPLKQFSSSVNDTRVGLHAVPEFQSRDENGEAAELALRCRSYVDCRESDPELPKH